MIGRKEIIPASVEDWSPAGQADCDQLHAEAVDVLREADAYFLVTGKVNGDRCDLRVMGGGAAPEAVTRMVVLNAATEGLRMYEQVFLEDE